MVRREGPDHAPHFEVEVSVAGHDPAKGDGNSKREAEQNAAKAMLRKLGLT
jgi:ribonuclease-3